MARRSEGGFTLIELLVVIIILGILAAVVVFAVGGVGDKGQASAVTIDARTIRTAQEAYCAQNGRYADGDALLAGGFLSELPQYHQVFARQGEGTCNGWQFSVLKTDQAGGYGPGAWEATDPPPNNMYPVFASRLPDGRVLVGGADTLSGDPEEPSDDVPVSAIWDPTSGAWTPADPIPEPVRARLSGSSMLLSDDPATPINDCASATINNCGKVLVREKFLFDGTRPLTQQWEVLTTPPGCYLCQDTSFAHRPRNMVQLKAGAGSCGAVCGQILITGDNTAGGTPEGLLFDPKNNSYLSVPYNYDATRIRSHQTLTLLPDGRVLGCCRGPLVFQTLSDIFDPVTLTWAPGPVPPHPYERAEAVGFNGGSPAEEPTPRLPNGEVFFATSRAVTTGAGAGTAGIYRPETGGPGSWRTIPGCSVLSPPRCQLIAVLADGRILTRYGTTSATFTFNPVNEAWVTATEMISSPDPVSLITVPLSSRGGPCGERCDTIFVASLGVAQVFRS
ncbi:MAG: prepilin-type N-terminal cleavage/methylation domain-containing protein [Acidimicrobiales bacterium]